MAIDLSSDFGSRAARRLQDELILWLTTTGGDGAPHPNPVWFLWNGEEVLIFSQPNQAKLRNIGRNGRVSLNFNSTEQGGNVVILNGTAAIDANGPSDTERANYVAKYADGIESIGLTQDSMLQTY